MKIVIKNPAPSGPHQSKWGDYHFGRSLARALESLDIDTVQHYWPGWNTDDGEAIIFVLHGKRGFRPPVGKISVLWILSHPRNITAEELDSYTLIYAASETHRSLLQAITRTPVELMRQCTDAGLFRPSGRSIIEETRFRRDTVFVANSRGTRRDMVLWALEAGVDLKLIGRHWEQVGLADLVSRDYMDNDDLPAFYRSARMSLNDHWPDMRHFGIINNRIFDCLACGLPVLSDSFPELREVLGNGVMYANSASEFVNAIKRCTKDYPEFLERTRIAWDRLAPHYTFDARAEQIISDIAALPRPSRVGNPISLSRAEVARLEASIRENVGQQMQRTMDLESRMNTLERMSLKKESEALVERVEACREDREALLAYATALELRYRKLLSSRTWRLMAPARIVMRWLRALLTGRKPARNTMPRRPKLRSKP